MRQLRSLKIAADRLNKFADLRKNHIGFSYT